MKKISIIVPVYNEQESLPFLYERLEKLINSIENYEFEILFVNDGSEDKTLDIIEEIASKDKKVKIISFSRNFGHQAAVTCGLRATTGDAVEMQWL